MKIKLTILSFILAINCYAQTGSKGYVLQMADGTINIPDSSITTNKISGLLAMFGSKQAQLISGTNIKTINGTTLLGSGDIIVGGGATSWGAITGTLSNQADLQTALNTKANSTSVLSRVFLPNDVINNNGSANTIADVTGLSFPVVANTTYKFKFFIVFSSAATTTGSRWSINGVANTFMHYTSQYTLTATSITNNAGVTAYNTPSGSSASSLASGNICIIEGIIRPTANGSIIARFASEISASAITAIGSGRSYVEYQAIN